MANKVQYTDIARTEDQEQFVTSEPIYIAYNHSGPGHYDAVTDALKTTRTEKDSAQTKCSCGKNKRDALTHCTDKMQWPCQKQNKSCTRKCRCFNCGIDNPSKDNFGKYTGNPPRRGCNCGSNMKRKDPSYKSCIDGTRKSKCPCLAGGSGCADICRCFNCCNIFQQNKPSISEKPLSQPRKRRRTTVSSYKTERLVSSIWHQIVRQSPQDHGQN